MRRGIWAIAVCLAVLVLISAPTACYLSRGAWEEAKILSRRQPISEIVSDPRTPTEVREKLKLVLAARQYAKDSLKLRTKDSFTTYSRLDHDTLVLVVSAAYRDTLKPYTWWFPIVGRVPYKGYFDFAAAKRDAKNLYDDGFDVYGWTDPVTFDNCWAIDSNRRNAPNGDGNGFKMGKGPGNHKLSNTLAVNNTKFGYTDNGADNTSNCTNCRGCGNGSGLNDSGSRALSGSVTNLSPCPSVTALEAARKADGSLPSF